MTTPTSTNRRDPEQRERAEAFAGDLKRTDSRALGVALATGAFALTARSAYAQSTPSVTDVLNFALTLEYLERAFYDMGVNESGVIPAGEAQGKYEEILSNEQSHVALLQDALGGDAVDEPDFDFTAGGNFDPFNDYNQFLVLSQGFEDTGVRAYKGQAVNPNLIGTDVLTTALRIHSVEARHASVVRRLVDAAGITTQDGWIEGAGANRPMPGGTDPLAAVYAGEDDTTVAGTDISGLDFSSELLTESYDEPLTMDEVLAIANLFIDDSGN